MLFIFDHRSGGHFELLGQGSLKINNITKADEGKYTCRGANSMDTADTEVSLSVLSKSFFFSVRDVSVGKV